ncbi:MAG TPA: hypothetical protein PLM29_11410 [Deltaproteobacteria bacterium]|nr:hypothetical protein [Deltaproteobacteria bacterium]
MFYRKLKSFYASHGSCETPEVQELIAQRDRFIADHPYLKSTQDEIDRLMGTTLDPMIRLEILFMLITDKLSELRTVFEEVMQLATMACPDA